MDYSFDTLNFEFSCEEPVSCLFCDEVFNVNIDYQPLLSHLLDEHHFLFDAVKEILDMRQYVLYWRKLNILDLQDYCIVYLTNTETGSTAPKEKYYLLTKKLDEDRKLREIIQKKKMMYLTQQKEIECQDKNFSRQCIYCRKIITGGVDNCFHHLRFEHGFSVGNPNNIVFGAKLLDIMEDTLTRLICLCCEKTFKNHIVLREHMRKKHHKSLNPKNKVYDQFYMLNYLKPGVPWKEAKEAIQLEKDDKGEEVTMNENEDHEIEADEWTEEDQKGQCLFCNYNGNVVPNWLDLHMKVEHNFDFDLFLKGLSFYEKIKLINFMRLKTSQHICMKCDLQFESITQLTEHLRASNHIQHPDNDEWKNEKYLQPHLDDDKLLLSLEDDDSIEEEWNQIHDEVVPGGELSPESLSKLVNLRSELFDQASSPDQMSSPEFRCFFCNYTQRGTGARTRCMDHMSFMHNFDTKKAFQLVTCDFRNNMINFIRYKTETCHCFVCDEEFNSKQSLQQHRTITAHTVLPHRFCFDHDRWSVPVVENDGFFVVKAKRTS